MSAFVECYGTVHVCLFSHLASTSVSSAVLAMLLYTGGAKARYFLRSWGVRWVSGRHTVCWEMCAYFVATMGLFSQVAKLCEREKSAWRRGQLLNRSVSRTHGTNVVRNLCGGRELWDTDRGNFLPCVNYQSWKDVVVQIVSLRTKLLAWLNLVSCVVQSANTAQTLYHVSLSLLLKNWGWIFLLLNKLDLARHIIRCNWMDCNLILQYKLYCAV